METVEEHGAPVEPGATQVERLLAELNGPQREAVTHGEGPLLVLAGADLAQRIAQRLLALTLGIYCNLLTGRPARALVAYDGR